MPERANPAPRKRRSWLRRRSCTHVLGYANGSPIYALRTAKATEASRDYWFGWVLGEHDCPVCGERFLDLRVGGRPL